MQKRFKLNIVIISVVTAIAAGYGQADGKLPDFSYYQVILDRKPFGEIAPAEPIPTGAVPPGESFAKNLELRAIIAEGDDFRVGLLDKQDNSSFYIEQGAPVNDIILVSVDYDAEEVVLRKNDETIVFTLRQEQPGTVGAPIPVPTSSTVSKSPFQPFTPPTSVGGTPRRPFFAELKRRRQEAAASGTNAQAMGFPGFFQPAKPADGTVAPSPFGPFTPISGTNAGFAPVPFGNHPSGQSAEGTPFLPFNPKPAGSQAEGHGASIEDLMQQQPDDSTSPFQPAGVNPFQQINE